MFGVNEAFLTHRCRSCGLKEATQIVLRAESVAWREEGERKEPAIGISLPPFRVLSVILPRKGRRRSFAQNFLEPTET